jgi:hypothetical protein
VNKVFVRLKKKKEKIRIAHTGTGTTGKKSSLPSFRTRARTRSRARFFYLLFFRVNASLSPCKKRKTTMSVPNVTTSNRFALLEIAQGKVSTTSQVEQPKTPKPTYTPPTLKKRLYTPPTEELSFAMGLWRFTLLAIATLSSLGKVEAAPCPKGRYELSHHERNS